MTNLIGQSLGRYHILEQLGEGGMATVYKAYDTRLEREVALKVILPQKQHTETFLKRFEREARTLAKLSHPNIVKVLDYGEQAGQPYLVMEYIPGGMLKQKMGKPMDFREAARLLLPVARALEQAHLDNIVHRDVKPSNILLTRSGDPMLTDFGIAKIVESEGTTMDLTGTGVGIGTPEYMAPEQGLGNLVDARADIYALGTVFYELICGRTPYQADTPMAIMLKKATEPLPRPSQFVPDLPFAVEKILIKALAKDPGNRYQSMSELIAAFESLAAGKLLAVEKRSGSGKLIGAAFLILLCLVALGGGTYAVMNSIADSGPKTPTPIVVETSSETLSASPILVVETDTLGPIQISSPTPDTGVVWKKDGMEMVFVPAGEFIRGMSQENLEAFLVICPSCNTESLADAGPQATVYLSAFWIDQTEVTNTQFAKFVSETGYRTTAETMDLYSYVQDLNLRDFKSAPNADWRHPQGANSNIASMDQHPVTQISWQDAAAYCEWAGKRLPTEAEWEKAARGDDGRLFPWGNEAPRSDYLNYDFLAGKTTEVGGHPSGASPYGVLDMSGNLWEWVSDYYGETYYQEASRENPAGPSTGEGHVFRGGSWASEFNPYLAFVTTVYRLWNYDYISSDVLGFRCATNLSE